jgi:hypothetical protein
MHERERAVAPLAVHRRERGMQSEMTIEIDDAVVRAGASNRDRRACVVVSRLSMRHHHVQAVDRAAQEYNDQPALAVGVE